jgi:hypothetical protein
LTGDGTFKSKASCTKEFIRFAFITHGDSFFFFPLIFDPVGETMFGTFGFIGVSGERTGDIMVAKSKSADCAGKIGHLK